jgi:2-C-methyl-D-erythritol 4-phosphate cytidylyltransferase
MSTFALIVAAGSSVRFGGEIPKQFRTLIDRPLLAWTIERFEKAESIDHIAIVVAEEFLLHTNQKIVAPYGFTKVRKIVIGGETRSESVKKGLNALPLSTRFVAIHDGARPLVRPSDIDFVVKTAQAERAAILGIPATDTVKRVGGGYILATLDRQKLMMAQTPQVFQYDLIREGYQTAGDLSSVTDDASLVEELGFKVKVCVPEGNNMKVTTADDLKLAAMIIRSENHE